MPGWDPSMETGDELVDEQHRQIHRLVADVESSRDEPGAIMAILDRLMAHVDVHFSTEETLMSREGYPAALSAAHVAEHRWLTARAREAVVDFRAGRLVSVDPLVEFLREWLGEHVHEHDREFIDFVRQRGGLAELPSWIDGEAFDGPSRPGA